jgi:hypothetical protein
MQAPRVMLEADHLVVIMPGGEDTSIPLRSVLRKTSKQPALADLLASAVIEALARLEQGIVASPTSRSVTVRNVKSEARVWSRTRTVALDDILTAATDAAAADPWVARGVKMELNAALSWARKHHEAAAERALAEVA